MGFFSTLQAFIQFIFDVLEFLLKLGSQGSTYQLYLVNTWNKHVSHMATKFLSKRSTKGFCGDDMHLCRFTRGNMPLRTDLATFKKRRGVNVR